MKVCSDTLTSTDVRTAFFRAQKENHQDIWPEAIRDFRPRGCAHGVEFFAYSHTGNQATGHRPVGSYPLDSVNRAPSWSAYGWVIAHLYTMDSQARIAGYKDVEEFISMCISEGKRRRQDTSFLSLVTEEKSDVSHS
jgi:hypothetical protein